MATYSRREKDEEEEEEEVDDGDDDDDDDDDVDDDDDDDGDHDGDYKQRKNTAQRTRKQRKGSSRGRVGNADKQQEDTRDSRETDAVLTDTHVVRVDTNYELSLQYNYAGFSCMSYRSHHSALHYRRFHRAYGCKTVSVSTLSTQFSIFPGVYNVR